MVKKHDYKSEDDIISQIYIIRGIKVMLDSDLAEIYGVSTTRLNEQVKRNNNRFPVDFKFQLTYEEFEGLKSQIATSNRGKPDNNASYALVSQNPTSKNDTDFLRSQNATLKDNRGRHRKYLPYVFTEHGAVMLASVLNSPVAVEASIYVVRAFVKLRDLLSLHKELADKISELEQSTREQFKEHAEQLKLLFGALKQLISEKSEPLEPVGFKINKK